MGDSHLVDQLYAVCPYPDCYVIQAIDRLAKERNRRIDRDKFFPVQKYGFNQYIQLDLSIQYYN
jgi:hypothetical protein